MYKILSAKNEQFSTFGDINWLIVNYKHYQWILSSAYKFFINKWPD